MNFTFPRLESPATVIKRGASSIELQSLSPSGKGAEAYIHDADGTLVAIARVWEEDEQFDARLETVMALNEKQAERARATFARLWSAASYEQIERAFKNAHAQA